jgi:hypothetical protein
MVIAIMTSCPLMFKPALTGVAFRRGFLAALPFIVSSGVAGVVMGVAYKGFELGLAPAVLFSLVVIRHGSIRHARHVDALAARRCCDWGVYRQERPHSSRSKGIV